MFEATDNVSKTVKNEHLKKEEPKYKKVTEKIEKNKNKEDVNKYRIQSALISRKERLYQPNYWDNYDIKEIKKKPKDSNKPEGYEFYQKNFGIFRNNYIKNNCIDSSKLHSFNGYMTMSNEKKPIFFRKFNQMRQNQSDIFFKKDLGDSKVKEIKQAQICKLHNDLAKYSESDIFNLRLDNKNIIGKSGEFSYFRNLNEDKKKLQSTYSVNNETQLGWGLRSSLPSFLNYTSTQFHLLNRSIKNIGNTKEKIMNESKKISPNFNPINRKKSLCEFIDLCRVSAPNINNDYNKAINENPNVFKKRNEISSEFYNIYNNYTNLCDKPFQKFSSMKINDNNH
jgi:hypothetical protein